ncbi:ABC transporter permease [Lysobacter capsici]|uniref:ABC transporter permease n=1 Tax=Lysobacter capsici TaxID=435897 RepID=UPI00207AFFB5|nr:ABC transporter permease [Lysobacter capsici]
MNATHDDLQAPPAARPMTTITPMQTFKMLLRREYWEHRGGFVWGPLIAGAIAIVLALITAIGLSAAFHYYLGKGDAHGVNLDFSSKADSAGQIGDLALSGGLAMVFMVFVFVVFFYALGSIYDERKDRSILFWKSLPISDTQAVLSKLLWALVLAPVLAAAIGLLVGLVLWVLAWLTAVANGVDGASAIFVQAHPLRVVAQVLLSLPVYALWALPTVGWLMLCSAWARSVPFIWAVVIPLLACVFIGLVNVFLAIIAPDTGFPALRLAYIVGYRGLLSVVPGSWMLSPQIASDAQRAAVDGPQALTQSSIDFTTNLHALTTIDLWVGAAIGAAMVYGAIRLRRWRDEG